MKLTNKIDYRKVLKVMVIIAITFFIINLFITKNVYAESMLDYGKGENPFNKIKDSFGQFINDKYRENYNFDLGKGADFADKIFNFLPNVIFEAVVALSWIGINVFNFCFSSNISGEFSKSLKTISTTIQTGTFNKYYMIFFMISLIALVVYFIKRNYAAVFTHIIGVTLIVSMSVILTHQTSRNFVMKTNSLSKEIGMSLIAALSGEKDTDIAKNDMIGTLWGNFVHKPWIIIEFDGKVSVDDENKDVAIDKSKRILSLPSKSDEREKIAKEEIKDVSIVRRFSSSLILAIITIIKIVILMIFGIVQMFLQVLSNIMIVFSPLILLLAIVPYFGGFGLLKWLAEKYIAIQVTIVFISFIIGALILIDKVMLEFFIGIGASFTVALLIQCVLWILVIVFRKQLVLNFNKLQNKINGTVVAGSVLGKGLDKSAEYGNKALDKGKKVGSKVTAPVKRKAVDFKDDVTRNIKYAGKYASGKAKIKMAKTTGDFIDKVASKLNKNNIENETEDNIKNTKENIDPKAQDKSKTNKKEKIFNIKEKLKEERNKISKEDKNMDPTSSTLEKENIKPTEEKIDPVQSNLKNKEVENDNINKENTKKKEEKVISFNEERVKKGKEKINDEKLKNQLRKDLQKEYRENLKEKQKIKEDSRAEKLKKNLGVTKKQIRSKEKTLTKELNSIKATRQMKK